MHPALTVGAVYVDLYLAQGSEGHVNRAEVVGKILVRPEQRVVDEPTDQFGCRRSLGSGTRGKGTPLLIGEVDVGPIQSAGCARTEHQGFGEEVELAVHPHRQRPVPDVPGRRVPVADRERQQLRGAVDVGPAARLG